MVVAVLALVLLAGCARAGEKLGQGEDVGFCQAWAELQRLDEPALDDRDDVLRWAEGVERILDRVDVRVDVDDERLPTDVRRGVERAQSAIAAFVVDVRAAGTTDAVREAQRDFADGEWDSTMAALAGFEERKCE